MRKLITLLLAVLIIQACTETKEKEGYQVSLDLEGSEGKWVKLMARVDRNYVTTDSVTRSSRRRGSSFRFCGCFKHHVPHRGRCGRFCSAPDGE